MNDQSQILTRTSCGGGGTTSATFSPESAGGHTPCNLPIGHQIDLFGQEVAPASHSRQPENKKAKKTNAISGQYGFALSASVSLQSSLENRLRQQLPMDGWMKSRMTWKEKITPLGRRYCQLAVSGHHTGGTVSGLWLPTIGANEGKGAGKTRFRGSPDFRGAKMSEGLRACETDPIYLNPWFAALVMGFPKEWVMTFCMDSGMPSSRKSPSKSSKHTLMSHKIMDKNNQK